ncbi:hypothetical protein Pyn_13939 [Prunus yedoensis var. nudiflora]|uniref:Uncharacterized protein n=1 Tax=Prunus yedoensis var. nudiflora TaxID=2094558 RepID=A0A314Y595_PRUYE|nr:hypothetical protein Pyn_13939 [Prunus yedoensis var. nudiflora]
MANLSPRFLFSNGVVSQPANTPPITSFLATHPPGGFEAKIYRFVQYLNLFGVAIGHGYGGSPLLLQSCPSLYSSIAKVAEIGSIKGSMTWICIGTVTQIQKIWRSFQALGDKAFACSYSLNLRAGAFLAIGILIPLLTLL